MASPAVEGTEAKEALLRLAAFVRGAMSLDGLIAWAEQVEAEGTDDPWLAAVAGELSHPLLCREQAMALVREFLQRPGGT